MMYISYVSGAVTNEIKVHGIHEIECDRPLCKIIIKQCDIE